MPFPAEEYFYDEFRTSAAVSKYREFRDSWPEGKLYDFNVEMHNYLRQDVVVLRAGCVRLLKEMLDFQDPSKGIATQHQVFNCITRRRSRSALPRLSSLWVLALLDHLACSVGLELQRYTLRNSPH